MTKFEQKVAVIPAGLWLMASLLGALALSSCQSPEQGASGPQTTSSSDGIYNINVLLYSEPVEVTSWVPDPRQSVNSEGAALNVIAAMQRGDVDAWLNSWTPESRPQLDASERQKLLGQWASLKGSKILVVGRVVAGTDLIEQIEVVMPSGRRESFQFPLQQQDEKWWLKKLDVNNEYMRWQNTQHKKIDRLDPDPLRRYVQDASARAK